MQIIGGATMRIVRGLIRIVGGPRIRIVGGPRIQEFRITCQARPAGIGVDPYTSWADEADRPAQLDRAKQPKPCHSDGQGAKPAQCHGFEYSDPSNSADEADRPAQLV